MTEQTSQTATPSTSSTEAAPSTEAPATGAAGGENTDAAATAAAEAAKAAEAAAKPGEQTPEQKAAAEAAKAEGKDGKAADAPITYEDFKIPDGAQINDEVMGSFKEFGAQHKFTQEQMQGLLDLQGKLNQTMIDTHKTTVEGWRKESENDKEFGGAKFKESLTAIAKGRDSLASQKFVELMDTYGLSEHPEVLRHFWKLGSRVSEDTSAAAAGSSGEQKAEPSRADILYGKKQ